MAKKAKAKKTKKASVLKKSAAPGATGAKTINVPLQSVLHFMSMIRDQGQSDKFARAAKKSKMSLSVPPETVKFVSKFLARKKLRGAMTASVVDPCPGDPFECRFRD